MMGSIESFRNVFEIVCEQVSIGVERHSCRGVTKHALHGLYVRAGADRETSRRVAQIMRGQSREDSRRIITPMVSTAAARSSMQQFLASIPSSVCMTIGTQTETAEAEIVEDAPVCSSERTGCSRV